MVMGILNDIKIKVNADKDCVQTLSVELPASRVKSQIEKAYQKVQGQAKLPGFRPGKTPIEIIKQQFKESAYAQAQEDLLQEGVTEAIQQKKITPVQRPVVQSLKFDPEKSFHFEFKVEVFPQFKLSGYKGIKATRKKEDVTDEAVNQAIGKIAESNAKLTESKETVLTKKHFAVVDYEGFMDDKPMQGAKADNFLMDMSAPQTIEGLAEGLEGTKVGESKEIPVKFPADSPVKELAGKEAKFKVKLNAIKEKEVPPINDDLAKDMGMESLDQLKDRVRDNIQAEKDQESKRDLHGQLVEKLLEENKFPVPESLVKKQEEYLIHRQMDRLTQQGIPKAEQSKVFENIKPQIHQQAEREIRLQFIMNAIGESEKIQVTDMEVSEKIKTLVEQSNVKDRKGFEKSVVERYTDTIRAEIRETKIFDWLVANSKIKEVRGGSK
jgi:trigger factor